MNKMLIPIALMILVSVHAAKLDGISSGHIDTQSATSQKQDRGFTTPGINSVGSTSNTRNPTESPIRQTQDNVNSNSALNSVGSTFNTRNPTFNSFNQASEERNRNGETNSAQLTGSTNIGAPGSSNLHTQGSRETFGSNQGARFNYGSPSVPTLQGPVLNIHRPGPPVSTGFRTNLQQLPFLAPNFQHQASRPFLVFPSGPSHRFSPRFNPLPTFTSGPSTGPHFGPFSSPVSSSISFNTISSQPATSSGIGSEFNVSPLRNTFQASNTGTDISPGNVQSTIKLISNPSLNSNARFSFQQPSQISMFGSSSNDDSNSGTSPVFSINTGPQIISAFGSGSRSPSQSSSANTSPGSGSNSVTLSSTSNQNQVLNSGSSLSSTFGAGFQQPSRGSSASSSSDSNSGTSSSTFRQGSNSPLSSTFVTGGQQPSQSPSTSIRTGSGPTNGFTSFNLDQSSGNNRNSGSLRGEYLPPNL